MPAKIISVFSKLILIMIIFQTIFIPVSNAGFWGDIISSGDQFLQEGSQSSSSTGNPLGDQALSEQEFINQTQLKKLSNQIYNLLLVLGIVLAVIIGAVLGIQFMWGSIEQQAKVKEALFPYVTGCIIIFGAFGIWKIVVTMLSKI